VYSIVGEEGPEHDKRFTCEVTLEGEAAGRGVGRTKKEAQQLAATAALARMDSTSGEEPPAG
jgi:ribonuclease-3